MSDDVDEPSDRSVGPVWIAIGVLLVAMAVFVILDALGGDDDRIGADTAQTPGATASRAASTTADANVGSVCGLGGHDRSGPLVEPPEGVTWTLVGRMAIPASDVSGPGVVDGRTGVRYCYARTRAGALLAAAGFHSWSEVPARHQVTVVEHGVASGPGNDIARQAAQDLPSEPAGEGRGEPVQIRGFQLLAYTDDAALVDLAFQRGSGFTHHQLELVWEGGDWRVRLRPDGTVPGAEAIPDLTGYVPWMGA